ncbi:cysteine desulfurase [Tubulinosema ratisbonensis]|uniref:Cysteine desulfurase, mitosomal n=1 Tax=Tubulinosema ratisbonensis TaxID=291195 RepID=A0A437AJQ8_9MICR|nr:cysteine desulfurase [Tubulinosema ratisbonensis]
MLKKVFLDYLSTTPVDPRVLDSMLPYMTSSFGNMHSRTHAFGWNAEAGVEKARAQVAGLINSSPREIVFTSGATESSNLAIKGALNYIKKNKIKKPHVITTQTEHKCVLETLRELEDEVEVTYLKVDNKGLIDLEELKRSIKDNTAMIAVMAVNNEIGTVQPLEEIGKIAKKNNILFFCDAAQGVGKIPIDVNKNNISLMSISGHKMYGPKGIGALFVKNKVRILPLQSGGGQERNFRSGTNPVPLIVGLGKAAEIAKEEMKSNFEYVKMLAQKLIKIIKGNETQESKNDNILPFMIRNGDENGYPGCVNLSFPYVEGESLLLSLPGVALSSGSACTSQSLEPSYVLRALGTKDDLAHSSIRFGLGKFTTEEEVVETAEKVKESVTKLREMSPLYEMVKEGINLDEINWGDN